MSRIETYEAVTSLYSTDVAWDETVTLGSRGRLNVAAEALEAHDRPESTAVRITDFDTGDQQSHTVREVNHAANRVANYLEARTNHGDRVATALPVSLALHAVLYGTIKAGRIYVPVPPSLDATGASYRLDDASPSLLVATPDRLDYLDPDDVPSLERIVLVDGTGTGEPPHLSTPVDSYDAVRDHDASFEAVECHPNDPYAISYTSGTTGAPKGCLQTHGKFVRKTYPHVAWVTGIESGDTYLTGDSPTARQDRPIATHVFGATIAYYRGDFDAEALLETVADFDVTTLHVPPSGIRQLRSVDPDPADLGFELTALVTGGEPLDRASIDWARETLGAAPLEGYGLTETGMVICNYGFEDWEIKPGSLGRPLPGLTVEVRDEAGDPVGPDEVGELVIELPPDFSGWYWGKPDRSVEEFQGAWYETGDLVRMDDDGYVWYVTRKSTAIHTDDGLVAPAEVEAALLDHDGVAEAGVTGVPGKNGDSERIKAVVTLADGTDASSVGEDDLRAVAASNLSPYALPDVIAIADALPKTSTGKIRRTDL